MRMILITRVSNLIWPTGRTLSLPLSTGSLSMWRGAEVLINFRCDPHILADWEKCGEKVNFLLFIFVGTQNLEEEKLLT